MTTETTVTVRYAETDAQGVAHHANYLVWFEEGRSDFLRQQGMNYTDFEQAGYYIVVAEANVKYKAPVFYEERLAVETTLATVRGKVVKFTYRVVGDDGNVRAEGETVHVAVGRDKKPTSLPKEILEKLKQMVFDRSEAG